MSEWGKDDWGTNYKEVENNTGMCQNKGHAECNLYPYLYLTQYL